MTASRLLELSDLLARQRAAILSRDPAALRDVAEGMAAHLARAADQNAVGRSDEVQTAERLVQEARRLREQLRINQMLLRNGSAIADHFARCCAASGIAGEPGLFTGIG
jgi:hypothetical protein